MTVTVRVPAALRPFAGNQAVVEVDVPAGADVAALLDRLAGEFPALERRVRDERGRLRPHVNLFAGDTNIRDLDQLATALADGGELVILPAVSGGG